MENKDWLKLADQLGDELYGRRTKLAEYCFVLDENMQPVAKILDRLIEMKESVVKPRMSVGHKFYLSTVEFSE